MLITFIGGGNMATALISGLANPPRAHIQIRVSDTEGPQSFWNCETVVEAVNKSTKPVKSTFNTQIPCCAVEPGTDRGGVQFQHRGHTDGICSAVVGVVHGPDGVT